MARLGVLFRALLRISVLLVAFSQCACAQANAPMVLPIDPVPLLVTTNRGAFSFQIEIAKTPLERSRGLMFREKLPEGRGMLFVFEEPDFQNFWMKDTPAALDIIYIASSGKVVSLHKGEPLSTNPMPSYEPAQFVLELADGYAEKMGLQIGDMFNHPVIKTTSK